MAQHNTAADSRDRFRRILAKLDEQDGPPPGPLPVPATPPRLTPARTVTAPPRGRSRPGWLRRVFSWEGFKTFAILFSLVVNLLLVLAVFFLGSIVFDVKKDIAQPLVAGLHENFVAMDRAHIRTTIPVEATIPVSDKVTAQFDLPLNQNTVVTLSETTLITGASVTINGGVLQLNNAPATIVLPVGTRLPITLDLSVPVDEDIPVDLEIPVSIPVAVDIPLDQTELHRPFANLRDLFGPYNVLMQTTPDSWTELLASSARR